MSNLNKGGYVRDAIESLLRQSYQNFELLFVDNGSTDGSREMAQECGGRDKRFISLSESAKGAANVFNKGLRESRGDLITFLDSDDVCSQQRLKKQVTLLDEDPGVAGCHTNAWIIDETGEPTGRIYHPDISYVPNSASDGHIFSPLLEKGFVLGMTMMLRRKYVERESFDVSLRYGWDWDLWLRLAYRYRFAYIPEPLYGYRIYSGNTPSTLKLIYHPLIYEKYLNSFDLTEDDRKVVIEKLIRLYRRNRSYMKLLRLLVSEETARNLGYKSLLRRLG
jgi:glycosyltransferase involved in cell wall biosynthesis